MRALEHEPALAAPGRLREGLVALADLVFPPFCPLCGERLGPGRRDPLCAACWAALPRIDPPVCAGCGVPLGAFAAAPTVARCAACWRRPPAWAYARAAGRFEGPLREAVHALKFDGRRGLARPLGDLLAGVWRLLSSDARVDVLVPVPLHPSRRRQRGFNQSRLLATRLGRAWGRPVAARALVRVRATPPQVDLSAAERRRNVRGAFRVRWPGQVRGRAVLLVDDVLTTGATAAECVERLRGAGAASVGVLTLARA